MPTRLSLPLKAKPVQICFCWMNNRGRGVRRFCVVAPCVYHFTSGSVYQGSVLCGSQFLFPFIPWRGQKGLILLSTYSTCGKSNIVTRCPLCKRKEAGKVVLYSIFTVIESTNWSILLKVSTSCYQALLQTFGAQLVLININLFLMFWISQSLWLAWLCCAT